VNPGDKHDQPEVKPITSPTGLDLHPEHEKSARVSKRATFVIAGVGFALLIAFAYGGYKRTLQAEAAARSSGAPKGVAPATAASAEFTKAIPAGSVLLAPKSGQEPDPAVNASACASDRKTGQPFRFDPQTGRPCNNAVQLERVVVRRAPPNPVPVQQQPTRTELTPEERRIATAYQLEQDALIAPTSVRGRAQNTNPGGVARQNSMGDVDQVAALAQALSGARQNIPGGPASVGQALLGSQQASDDYELQNMQSRKQAFLESGRGRTSDYLQSTRTAPLSAYEIKAGWEIPAALERALNSDLPGELKALVTSNVYDTATGRHLLIPQGSRLIGRYDSRIAYGQDGVQVAWSRLIFPDASSIDLDGMVGLDAQGNAGLRSKVDRHYKRMFGFAALSSLFTAAFEVAQRRNQSILVNPSAGDTASAAVGRELSQTGAMMTRRNMNVQPTIKVPVGYKFTVRVNRDILFEAPYEPLLADPQPLPRQQELRKRAAGFVEP
jgi:type IV secretory pathway VirB10-like protein